ncbi:MAG: thymidylate kinase [Bacilli bacterium]|nr:thymidylate kinase [Bacilli bacterium]
MGKLIVIEGTDCSGKGTQSDILLKRFEEENKKVIKMSFPMYDTPTGRIIGGPYLGKESICHGWFKEGANNVPAKVASLYYAADRLYNIDVINHYLDNDYIVILDRYVTSNMGHQAGKIKDKNERYEMFKWLEKLEYDLLELPKPDIKLFLHMPYTYSKKLQNNRVELDEHELSEDNLINAENAYLEMTDLFDFIKIECVKDNNIRSIEEISEEIYNKISELL